MKENIPILTMKNIKKAYYGNKVLKGISLEVMPGEIHALCGENGAGKSTLMNILFGMSVIHSTGGYEGEISMDGKPVSIMHPSDAMKLGIGMVHQEFMLIPGFSIAENIKLNREPLQKGALSAVFGKKLQKIDEKKVESDSRKALDKLGMEVDEHLPVAGLPVGYMQFIEIAREIDKENIRLLVFDEPTAVLTESEASSLLAVMKKLASEGVGILFITHRLDEVIDAADKITVMRDGTWITTVDKKDTTIEKIAELMVGREIDLTHKEATDEKDKSKIAISIHDLKVTMPGEIVRGVNLDVYEGEILGLGGLAGQGKIGIANGLMGIYPTSGEVLIDGKKLTLNSPKMSIASGLSFVSEDRRGVGLVPDTSIELNMVIPAIANQNRFIKRTGPFSQVDTKEMRATAQDYIKDLDIRCTGSTQAVKRLSGGNQQKVCIARALILKPNVLLISEPTRGIDIGAKSLVLDTIVKLNKEFGLTVIMTSSELAELRLICDRIAIVTGGKILQILAPTASDSQFGLAMAGHLGKDGAEA
ncbi:MAG: sugar ABC transporter ATP-binding protein [Hydrogenoanaerobacterium sp.]